MQELVESLISKQCEGLWWDFKQKFPSELIDMLHDITCLANVIHDGDRYLVYGVADDYEIVGLEEDDNHHTQADVINYLRQQPYAENCEPQISLTDIEYEGKKLAILTVKNIRLKPYYFTKEIRKGKHLLRAGTIYSRVGDTNTPKDSCARPKDAEAMWHERFGLGLRPDERFSVILEDVDNWEYNGIDGAYYILDPDYKLEIGEKEYTGGNYWWQNELAEEPIKFNYLLKFKGATLHEVPVVRFQKEQLCIPFPDISEGTIMHPLS
ncbi:ATP-binding protein [Microbulbifer variabilis]|uniref:ATP-binding protein n=1 Tax=Microbulbifer variabilis TaxID=266805 RepID=UPI001CFE3CD3|nr:ATP-binding protein [Microbulbifer variabilis]